MNSIRLNQVTLGAIDMAASVLFYQRLGLTLIVDSAPRYVRFEFPDPPGGGEPATLSLHGVEDGWRAPSDWPLIYFEVDDVAAFIAAADLTPIAPPEMKSYDWEEADILDPSGNRIRLFKAGRARRFPDWRIQVERFLAAWSALPLGHFDGLYEGRRYGVTRTERAGGRQAWLWAEELGGPDRISGNLYRLQSGAQLKPCEMPAEKVIAFVLGVEPLDTSES